MATVPSGQPAEASSNQPAPQPAQPANNPADASEKPKDAPAAVKPEAARRDLTKATNETVTGEGKPSKEDQELTSYVESLGIEDPNFKKLILFFAKIWSGINRVASNFSLFDDLDKTPKGNKLNPEDEQNVKNLWKRDLAKIDQAKINELKKLGNEAAATSYVCVALGISEMTDPRVLLESLDNVKMGENRAFSRIPTFDQLVNQKPLKRDTVVFSNFNLLTGELIPFIATGNGGELKMLYPDLKADSKSKDLPKTEQSIYAYGGEPSLTRFQFRAALMPTFAVSAQDSVVDANDDSDLGKVLAYEPKTKELFTDINNTLQVIADFKDSATVDNHNYRVAKFNYVFEPLAKISTSIEELSANYLKIVKDNPDLKPKLLEKFKAAHGGFKDVLTKIGGGIDAEITKLDNGLKPIVEKMSPLKEQIDRLANAGKNPEAQKIEEGELKQLAASQTAIEAKMKELTDIKPKLDPYAQLSARLAAILEDQTKPGEQPAA